jgi:hypothetical protein
VQAGEEVVCAINWSAVLDGIAEMVAMPAREEPAAIVELCNAPAAIHAVAQYVTDEPGPLAAEVTGCPADRDSAG